MNYLTHTLDILFPKICPLCEKGQAVGNVPVCESCVHLLKSEIFLSRKNTKNSGDVINLWEYSGYIKKCLKSFKYKNRHDLNKLFRIVIEDLKDDLCLLLEDPDIILPVPSFFYRYISRGYNQSELIAKAISDVLERPFSNKILISTSKGTAQAGLPKYKRETNRSKSFSVANKSKIKNKNILLVDDIVTTGATLESCMRKLLREGANSINGFALARA